MESWIALVYEAIWKDCAKCSVESEWEVANVKAINAKLCEVGPMLGT